MHNFSCAKSGPARIHYDKGLQCMGKGKKYIDTEFCGGGCEVQLLMV